MSSDKLASVQEPLVSIDLDLQHDTIRKTVSLELNKQDLHKVITSLEEANEVSRHNIYVPVNVNPQGPPPLQEDLGDYYNQIFFSC